MTLFNKGLCIGIMYFENRILAKIVSVLERCLLERYLYWRDVCIGETSVLERHVRIRDVCIRGMSVLERYLY